MPNIKLLYLIDPYTHYPKWASTRAKDRRYWPEDLEIIHYEAEKLLYPFKSRVKWILKFFEECTKNDVPQPLDFIYIDGSHAYKHVIKDLFLAAKLVKKGGVIGGHDAGCLDIEKATEEFCKAKHVKRLVGNNGLFSVHGVLKCQGWDWWIING